MLLELIEELTAKIRAGDEDTDASGVSDLLFQRGIAYQKIGDFKRAIADSNHALRLVNMSQY